MALCFIILSLVMWAQHSLASVPTTIVESAIAEGALCLDGSAPAYNWDVGKGDGAKNWLVYLQGAGWCLNSTVYQTIDMSVESCKSRAKREVGSSHYMKPLNFSHIFDAHPNGSYFYNWNRVIIRYCDGGSFTGDAENPDPVTKLYYRGARIFRVVIKELMTKGLSQAKNVLLAGGSAGGVGVMVHCDNFRSQFAENVRVKCHTDSSLFLRVKDPHRAKFFNTVFGNIVGVHHPEKVLPTECTSKYSAIDCFFPQNLLGYIKSPIFILNSAFDSFQIHNTFSVDLYNRVKNHTLSPTDLFLLQNFRKQIIKTLPKPSTINGYLITSISGHSIGSVVGYKGPMFPQKNSKSFESAIVNWFFDKSLVHLVDPADDPFYDA